MTDAKRIAKLEAQVAALRARLAARTTQLTLVLLQISDMKAANRLDSRAWQHADDPRAHLFTTSPPSKPRWSSG